MKEQLDIIISDLQASMGRDAAESANAGEMGGGKPSYAIIGTGMMGREHILSLIHI